MAYKLSTQPQFKRIREFILILSIERAEDNGYEIIGNLVRASLLMEEVGPDQTAFVCMPDVVREMALWIATELGIQKEAFIVRAGVRLSEIPKVKNWNVVRRMSLMKNFIAHLADSPECLHLITLLLQDTELGNISSEFFRNMPKLLVLDLSGNRRLQELPDGISNLESLQYLNLSKTCIRNLPKGLQELKKLIHLDLEETWRLSSIAGISNLHNLKVLKLSQSRFSWDLETVKELETLEHLEILTTTINDCTKDPKQFLSSHRLMSRTRFLKIQDINNLESGGISLSACMDKLRGFRIEPSNISEINMGRTCSFLSLSEVRLGYCNCLRELTFLMFAPNLRYLRVEVAEDLEDIINKEKALKSEEVPFQKLSHLHLEVLPKLKNIYWSPLPLACLERFNVSHCPNLKKLPLDSKSGMHGENGLVIKFTKKEWIEGVEWEDEATKNRFLSSCLQAVKLRD